MHCLHVLCMAASGQQGLQVHALAPASDIPPGLRLPHPPCRRVKRYNGVTGKFLSMFGGAGVFAKTIAITADARETPPRQPGARQAAAQI